jgi:proline racemase
MAGNQSEPIDITTIDMHTGGEPVRIVTGGYPEIPGATILVKRRYTREHLDHLRKFLMFEPRGHFDMYGVIPVEPDIAGADMAVLFMHNEGYSTMCGHAVIALGRYAIETGLVAAREPETTVTIQCPCGPVVAHVAVTEGKPGRVRFESVPAFAFALEKTVMTGLSAPISATVAPSMPLWPPTSSGSTCAHRAPAIWWTPLPPSPRRSRSRCRCIIRTTPISPSFTAPS